MSKKYVKKGKCYIMRFTLEDGDVVHKVGVTTRRIETRVKEVANSFCDTYKYMPMVQVLKKENIPNYFGVEGFMLRTHKHLKVKWVTRFDGSSEFIRVPDEDKLLEEYMDTIVKFGYNEPEEKYIPEEDKIKDNVVNLAEVDLIGGTIDMNQIEPSNMDDLLY
jgi:hypothetical protein